MLSTINVINHLCQKNALKAYKDSLKLPLLSNFLQGDTVKLWGQQMKLSWRTTEKLRKWQGPGSCWARIDMEILLRMFQARLKFVECRSISIWITWYNIFIIYILYIRYDWCISCQVAWSGKMVPCSPWRAWWTLISKSQLTNKHLRNSSWLLAPRICQWLDYQSCSMFLGDLGAAAGTGQHRTV